jgi:hypothetical protein
MFSEGFPFFLHPYRNLQDEAEAAGHLSRLLLISIVCGVSMLLVTEYFASPLLKGDQYFLSYDLAQERFGAPMQLEAVAV